MTVFVRGLRPRTPSPSASLALVRPDGHRSTTPTVAR
jgi:hypothetical protein